MPAKTSASFPRFAAELKLGVAPNTLTINDLARRLSAALPDEDSVTVRGAVGTTFEVSETYYRGALVGTAKKKLKRPNIPIQVERELARLREENATLRLNLSALLGAAQSAESFLVYVALGAAIANAKNV